MAPKNPSLSYSSTEDGTWALKKTYSHLARDKPGDELQKEYFEAIETNGTPPKRELMLSETGLKYEDYQSWEKFFRIPPAKSCVSKLLRSIIENEQKPDIVLRIENVNFFCQMEALTCYSSFFAHTHKALVDLPRAKMRENIFRIIYDWILADKPIFVMEEELCMEVLHAANYLRIPELARQCWVCISNAKHKYFEETYHRKVYEITSDKKPTENSEKKNDEEEGSANNKRCQNCSKAEQSQQGAQQEQSEEKKNKN